MRDYWSLCVLKSRAVTQETFLMIRRGHIQSEGADVRGDLNKEEPARLRVRRPKAVGTNRTKAR
jgi:hypothetical protein